MTGLGELESAVMGVLWGAGQPRTVRAVLDELNEDRALAYTTVLTVLDNLHRKGWAQREMAGRAFLYQPTESREAATARALRELLDAANDPAAVLLHFAKTVSPMESITLRQALTPGGYSR